MLYCEVIPSFVSTVKAQFLKFAVALKYIYSPFKIQTFSFCITDLAHSFRRIGLLLYVWIVCHNKTVKN